jgi:hypothetical protein
LYFEDFSNALLNVFKTNPGYQKLPLSVKHKFKVHDWVVDGDRVAIIYDLQKNGYVGHDVNRRDFVCRYSDESRLHLWTTADAKDGDVLVCYSEVKGNPIEQTGIVKQYVGRHGGCSNAFLAHTGIDWDGNIIINGYMGSTNILPATKEQRDLLFKKMREAGYEWDADKKELRKVQSHYDITNLHAGMPVLVRNSNESVWVYLQYSHRESKYSRCFNAGGQYWYQCIPFNVHTEHLLGTTDMCAEEFINWVI